MIEVAEKIVRAPCNMCGQNTEHDIIHIEIVPRKTVDLDIPARTEVLSCRGCKEVSIKREFFEEGVDEEGESAPSHIVYAPPRLWHRPPKWLAELEQYDPDLKGLLDEVYSAVHDKQTRLLSMGVRSVLDRVMTLVLGGDVGNFEQRLSAMVSKDHLTQKQADNLEIVIDAGSASTHRGFRPPRELMEEMVIVMESLVREHFITGPMLKTARLKIPSRPPNPPKTKRD